MQKLAKLHDPIRWHASDLPPTVVDNNVEQSLSRLDPKLDHKNFEKLSQALTLAGMQLPQYKLVDNHPNLPTWWAERKNNLFLPVDIADDDIPAISSHPGIPLPEKITIFANGKSDYSILLWGAETLVYISPNAHLPQADFAIGDGFLFIGPDVRSTARLNINCRNNGSVIIIKDVLIGSDVKFQTDDCHTIISLDSNMRINPFGGSIIVRNHVWIGEGALILGDCQINENCIVGARSFLKGVSTPSNSILAGVPAKVTRSGVTWDSRDLPPD